MDGRQFANECLGCRHNGVECRLWNEGLCHEQDYYEKEVPVGAKNTEQQSQPDNCGKCFYPKAFIVCNWFESGLCKSPDVICRST